MSRIDAVLCTIERWEGDVIHAAVVGKSISGIVVAIMAVVGIGFVIMVITMNESSTMWMDRRNGQQ